MSETPAWRGFAHRFGVIALLTGAATVRNMAVIDQRDDDDTDLDATDLDLLRRFEPVVRFNEGEYFLPASVESFVARAELWERTGPSSKRMVAPAGSLELDTLVERTQGHLAQHYLRLVSSRPSRAEYFGWQHRRDRPRFRPETRLGRVGVLTRLVDAAARVSLLARGRTPRGAQAAAAMLDRDRSDHGDHPYYGRVVHNAGYVVLQYWFFSYFNDWRSRAYGVNDHEGDWEQVSIYLVENDHGLRPAWIRRRWDDPDLTFVDGHPVVFAGLGSHAGAVLPGEYLITVRTHRLGRLTAIVRRISRFFQPWAYDEEARTGVGIPYVEYNRGDGVAIGPGTATSWRPVVIDDRTPWVRSYTGLWGDDTNDPFGGERGPAGPRYERNGTVRASWADPVGWSALDAIAPTETERRAVIEARLDELVTEEDDLATRREQLRRQLRADTIAAVADTTAEQRTLADLAARAVENADEQARLAALRDGDIVVEHPHAHLGHRPVPLATDPKQRRRLLRIWATISTPLLFVLLALVVGSKDRSILGSALTLFVVVLGIEALSRRRLVTYLVRVALLVGMLSVGGLIVAGLIASWQVTLVVLLLTLATVFLVLNLRELRRT
jgi:hypothetical protein